MSHFCFKVEILLFFLLRDSYESTMQDILDDQRYRRDKTNYYGSFQVTNPVKSFNNSHNIGPGRFKLAADDEEMNID